MYGKVVVLRPLFPYTFPIDFNLHDTGQIFDDTSEDYEYEIRHFKEFRHHEDVQLMYSTDVFPPDGTAPVTPFTRTKMINRPFNRTIVGG